MKKKMSDAITTVKNSITSNAKAAVPVMVIGILAMAGIALVSSMSRK